MTFFLYCALIAFVCVAASITVRRAIAAINAHTTSAINAAMQEQARALGLDANAKARWHS